MGNFSDKDNAIEDTAQLANSILEKAERWQKCKEDFQKRLHELYRFNDIIWRTPKRPRVKGLNCEQVYYKRSDADRKLSNSEIRINIEQFSSEIYDFPQEHINWMQFVAGWNTERFKDEMEAVSIIGYKVNDVKNLCVGDYCMMSMPCQHYVTITMKNEVEIKTKLYNPDIKCLQDSLGIKDPHFQCKYV